MENKEIMEAAANLGAMLKLHPAMLAADQAEAAYLADTALQEKMNEYGVHQQAIADLVGKEDSDECRKALEHRLDTLYDEIMEHPLYVEYIQKKDAVNDLMSEVNEAINFAITGKHSCHGNCHGCSGCH